MRTMELKEFRTVVLTANGDVTEQSIRNNRRLARRKPTIAQFGNGERKNLVHAQFLWAELGVDCGCLLEYCPRFRQLNTTIQRQRGCKNV